MSAKVLIIDDDRAIAQLTRVWLRAAGFQVATAHDGKSGLCAARSQKPDMILLDIRMPEMDGFQVLAALRGDDGLCDIPVVFLSANSQETARTRAMQGGAKQFLSKPYDAGDLINAVRSAIESNAKPAAV